MLGTEFARISCSPDAVQLRFASQNDCFRSRLFSIWPFPLPYFGLRSFGIVRILGCSIERFAEEVDKGIIDLYLSSVALQHFQIQYGFQVIEKNKFKSQLAVDIFASLAAGPKPSSQIYTELGERGHAATLARSTVSRLVAAERLYRYRLKLGHGITLLSVGRSKPDPRMLKSLCVNNFHGRPALKNLIDCLRTSHPSVTRADIAALAVLEIGEARQTSPEWTSVANLVESLEELGFLDRAGHEGMEPTWVFNKPLFVAAGLAVGIINVTPAHLALRRRVRYNISQSVAEWLRENTIVSDSGTITATHGRPANYLSLPFDVVGFSYLSGVATRDKDGTSKPRAVIGDCLLEECNLPYAKSFAMRVDQCAAKKQMRPLAFVIGQRFEHGAFMYLKQHGIAAWTQSQLLGRRTPEAIQRILTIAEGLVQQQAIDPSCFTEIFESLDNFPGLFGNLKGTLFELVVAYVFHRRTGNTRLGWEITGEHQAFDVDVFATNNSRSSAVECKGIKAQAIVPDGEVRRHFQRRVPLARSIAFSDRTTPIRYIKGIVVTTGGFEQQSIDDLARGAYGKREDTDFELWDRRRLLKELAEDGLQTLARLIERYYS